MKSMRRRQTLHVFNSTHWDREWLLPFSGYREHLLDHNDRLIELMERDPAYRHYMMDGQSICMEDYLRLKPHRAGRLRKLVRAGRILVGPWYTLPDMPLLHGEAVARNLLVGLALSESLGGAMREGYTACSNGQIAQLPQIYNGFDIRSAVLYKGIADNRAPREFRWQSPDGSEVLALHLAARYGRTNFYCMLYHEVIANVIHDTPDQNWEYAFTENWYPFRADGLPHQDPHSYVALNSRERWYPRHLRPYLAKLREQTARGAATSHLAGFHCMDHTPPFPATPKLIAAANRVFPDLAVKDSTLPEYFAGVRREAGSNLPVHVGELRDPKIVPQDRELWWPTLSARMNLKIANRLAEHWLIDTAEPAGAWAWMKGAEYPAASLNEAWKLLLASQAHDSIDGCGADKVARDMVERLADVQAMSEEMVDAACRHLLQPALTATRAVGRMPEPHIVLFNFDTRPRGGFCSMEVDLPGPKPEGLRLVTDAGRDIVPHLQVLVEGGAGIRGLVGRPLKTHRCRIQFEAPEVAPMSWRVLKVVPARAPANRTPPLLRNGRILENGFLKAVVRRDGRVDLTDKATGAVYQGLHGFEDVGDAGDPWHFQPAGETIGPSGAAEIRVVENTPWRAAVDVTVSLSLPADRLATGAEGAAAQRRMSITSRFSLTRSGRRLDVETTFDNPSRNHRLRVCFPTGIEAATTYAGGQFSVDERPTRMPDMSAWMEKVDGYPNYGFAGLSDGRRGLAVLNLGLPEYFVTGARHDVLTLTLLRTMRLKRRPAPVGEGYVTGLQQLGPQTVRYALYPHAGGWREGNLWRAYREYARPLLCTEVIGAVRTGGPGMLQLESDALEVACVKKAEREDALVVRVWNPADVPREGSLTLGAPFASVVSANLNEEPRDAAGVRLRAARRTVRLTVEPRKVVTLLFRFARRKNRRSR